MDGTKALRTLFHLSNIFYKDFEDRFALVETKLPALETVRRATMNKISRFTKQNIRELCRSLSISSIEALSVSWQPTANLREKALGKISAITD